MKTINTVLGPIPAEQLGRTLIHEHVICTSPVLLRNFGDKWFVREDIIKTAVQKLKTAKERIGLNTVVDATPLNLGRDLELLAEVSRRSGVNIIASTGMYYYEDFSFNHLPEDVLAEQMINECLNGNPFNGIRPGFLKCASDYAGITPFVRKIHKIMGKVQAATGLPIFVHTRQADGNALEQIDILLENGADLNKIIIGHAADENNPEYALAVLKRGSMVSIDRIYRAGDAWRANKVNVAYELIRQGWSSKILFAHDYIMYCDNDYYPGKPESSSISHHSDPEGLCAVDDLILRDLREKGIAEEDLDIICNKNPEKLFI